MVKPICLMVTLNILHHMSYKHLKVLRIQVAGGPVCWCSCVLMLLGWSLLGQKFKEKWWLLTFIIKNKVYYVNRFNEYKERIKEIFEDESIKKIGYTIKKRCHTFTGGQRKLQYKIQIQLNEIFLC